MGCLQCVDVGCAFAPESFSFVPDVIAGSMSSAAMDVSADGVRTRSLRLASCVRCKSSDLLSVCWIRLWTLAPRAIGTRREAAPANPEVMPGA
jgi:hypothetical protein